MASESRRIESKAESCKARPGRTLKATIITFLCGFSIVFSLPLQAASETVTYYHTDILGSPVAATDETGNVLWEENYRPYGSRIDNNKLANDTNIRWFTGHPQDETGLIYAGARYYDPIIGRFMGIDPIEFQEDDIHSFNRYAYSGNNPIVFIDPNGLWRVSFESYAILGGGFSITVSENTHEITGKFGLGLGGGFEIDPSADVSPHAKNDGNGMIARTRVDAGVGLGVGVVEEKVAVGAVTGNAYVDKQEGGYPEVSVPTSISDWGKGGSYGLKGSASIAVEFGGYINVDPNQKTQIDINDPYDFMF